MLGCGIKRSCHQCSGNLVHSPFQAMLLIALFLITLSVFGVKAAPHNATDGHNHNQTCIFVTEMSTVFNESYIKCKEELKLSDSQVPKLGGIDIEPYEKYFETVAKNGMDDKCFSRCLMEKIKIVTPSGIGDLKAIEKLYKKGNMTQEVVTIVMKEWSGCNDKADKEYPDVKEKDKLCRKAFYIDRCLFDRSKEIELPACL